MANAELLGEDLDDVLDDTDALESRLGKIDPDDGPTITEAVLMLAQQVAKLRRTIILAARPDIVE